MLQEPDCLPEPSCDAWPVGKKAAFFTLFLSCLFLIMDFLDRQVLAALFPYIKRDMDLSDTQLGMLVSVVNISIAILTVPVGYLIDRWSRKYMMGIMTFVWSLATGACAFAGGFSHLMAARFFVGAGEAGYVPAAQSLITASFPEKFRTSALSVFVACSAVGAPLGLVLGAFIAGHWGWRHAFGIVAVPGVLAAFLCITLKDFTVKKACAPEGAPSKAAPASGESWGTIILSVLRTPSCLLAFLALTANLMFASVMMNWGPSYFNRVAGMDPTKASLVSALILFGIAIGQIGYGVFMDWLRRKSLRHALSYVAFAGFGSFFMELAAFGLCSPGSIIQVALFMGGLILAGCVAPMCYTVTADLTLPNHRGTAVALLTAVQNLLGMAMGPFLVGILSDNFGLGTSMMLFTVVQAVVGASYLGIRHFYQRDMARLEKVVVQF